MNIIAAPPPWMNEEIWQEAWAENPAYFLPEHWVALYLSTVDPALARFRQQAEARLASLPFSFSEVLDYLGDPKETLTAYSLENLMSPAATWADAATMIVDRDLVALLIETGEWLMGRVGRRPELERTLSALWNEAATMDHAMTSPAPRVRMRELLAREPPWELQGRLPFLLPEIRRLTVPKVRGPWAALVAYPTKP